MTKQSSVRLSVIGLLLAVAVGAPVASILGNAPRSTASLDQAPSEVVMPAETVHSVPTLSETVIVASPSRRAPAAKKAHGAFRCQVRGLESVSDGQVRVCATEI